MPWINRKQPLLPSELPPDLRDDAVFRYSTLHNATGYLLLTSQSIEAGRRGKLRVAIDRWGRAFALKCFLTTARPPKIRDAGDRRPVREAWPLERVHREAQVMRQASSDLMVYDVIEAHGKAYIVHTLGQSGLDTLLRYIPERIEIATASFVMHQMASKIGDLHRRGFVHGDIKISNALFQYDRVMLCDFGATQALGADGRVHPGLVSTYPAPEQAYGHRYGTAADVWSLGATWGDLFAIHDTNPLSHRTTLKQSADKIRDFAVWRAKLFDDKLRFRRHRVGEDPSPWSSYFAPRMHLDAPAATFVVTRMLDPDARCRATFAQVVEFFAPKSLQQHHHQAISAQALRRLARGSKVQRKLHELRCVFEYNRIGACAPPADPCDAAPI